MDLIVIIVNFGDGKKIICEWNMYFDKEMWPSEFPPYRLVLYFFLPNLVIFIYWTRLMWFVKPSIKVRDLK
jgi:hypothetical protein